MGLSTAKILLDNPRLQELQPIEVDALADTGALFLCIPEHVANQLQLVESSKKEVTTADGRRQLCPYVGPIHIRYKNRECYAGAVVLGNEVLLGAVPMEDMDLIVIPSERRVEPNPLNPNFAAGSVKGFQANEVPLTIAPGQGRVVFAFGTELTFHLTGEQTGGQYALATIVAPPGDGPPPHFHDAESESFLVLDGRISFLVVDEWREVEPGTLVYVPKGTVHTYKNLGDQPSRIILTAAPSGFEIFFMRCEEEFCRPGGPDMARIVEISTEHGIHYVNP